MKENPHYKFFQMLLFKYICSSQGEAIIQNDILHPSGISKWSRLEEQQNIWPHIDWGPMKMLPAGAQSCWNVGIVLLSCLYILLKNAPNISPSDSGFRLILQTRSTNVERKTSRTLSFLQRQTTKENAHRISPNTHLFCLSQWLLQQDMPSNSSQVGSDSK